MSDVEIRFMSADEMGDELRRLAEAAAKDKYSLQVKLEDVDFGIDKERLAEMGIAGRFQSIQDAERALQAGALMPTVFVEYDGTRHEVLAFGPTPIGYSGFNGCVTHSLSVTDQGLFNVGRFSAVNLAAPGREWQWFLHECHATGDQVIEWMNMYGITAQELLSISFEALVAKYDSSL